MVQATIQARKTTIRPLHDRVLVKRLVEPDVRYGRLMITHTAQGKAAGSHMIAGTDLLHLCSLERT